MVEDVARAAGPLVVTVVGAVDGVGDVVGDSEYDLAKKNLGTQLVCLIFLNVIKSLSHCGWRDGFNIGHGVRRAMHVGALTVLATNVTLGSSSRAGQA